MPLFVYTGTCGHEQELLVNGKPPTHVRCLQCDGELIRDFLASCSGQKAWLPPMRKRMKKIFARWNNRDYKQLQGIKGTRNSFFDPNRRSR